MNVKFFIALLAISLVGAGVCGAQASADKGAPAATDACRLIENAEVEAVQGARVQGRTPSSRRSESFLVSQCYYSAASADGSGKNLSVHLELTEPDPKTGDRGALKEFWEERFREFEEGEREGKGERERERARGGREEEEESEPARRVEGVGDEAFWLGNNRAGALYVLKGGHILRLSVGGPEPEASKIEKSKALAAKALRRLG